MANMPAGIIVSDAVHKIMRQPYFRTSNERWGMGTLSARWAAEAIMKMAKPMRFLNQPKQRIRRQPYFGVDKSAQKTIKIRMPNRYPTQAHS